MTLHYYRNPATGFLTSSQPGLGKTTRLEPIIPVPAALVTDELLDALNVPDWGLRDLRDALIAGRPEPEPLAEPTDPSVRVLTRHGHELARLSNGKWVGYAFTGNWEQATDQVGPLRLADGAP